MTLHFFVIFWFEEKEGDYEYIILLTGMYHLVDDLNKKYYEE